MSYDIVRNTFTPLPPIPAQTDSPTLSCRGRFGHALDPIHVLRNAVSTWAMAPADPVLYKGVVDALHLGAFGGRVLSLLRAFIKMGVEIVQTSNESQADKSKRVTHNNAMKVLRSLLADDEVRWLDDFIQFLQRNPEIATGGFLKKRDLSNDDAALTPDERKRKRELNDKLTISSVYKRAAEHLQATIDKTGAPSFDDGDIFSIVTLANYVQHTRDFFRFRTTWLGHFGSSPTTPVCPV